MLRLLLIAWFPFGKHATPEARDSFAGFFASWGFFSSNSFTMAYSGMAPIVD